MKLIYTFLFAICYLLYASSPVFAQSIPSQNYQSQETFMKGQILKVLSEQTQNYEGYNGITQSLQVKILDGSEAGKIITIQYSTNPQIATLQKYTPGATVVIDKVTAPTGQSQYNITDSYRMNEIYILAAFFLLLTILIVGKRGIGAVLGLSISLAVILLYIIPQIVTYHQDALTVSLIGSGIILLVSTFLAHGFSRQTAIAIASTFLALVATYFFATIGVWLTHLAGLGTEDSYLLEITPSLHINPQGLLLGGIIIGTLGALNDVTTTQVASVFALFKANREQTFSHLITHGLSIGKEHIASMINTLVLAYAGTSLPIFIFLIINPQNMPYWVIINSESFAEEIVRTLTGSMGLMLAVPFATLLAAILAPKIIGEKKEDKIFRAFPSTPQGKFFKKGKEKLTPTH